MELSDLIDELKEKRANSEGTKMIFNSFVNSFENSPEYQLLAKRKKDAALEVDECESRVKEFAALNFDGVDKHPHPNVDIDMRKIVTVEFDKQKAHEWALTHNTAVLELNEKEFKKLVVSQKVPSEIATFSEKTVPTPTISAKL